MHRNKEVVAHTEVTNNDSVKNNQVNWISFSKQKTEKKGTHKNNWLGGVGGEGGRGCGEKELTSSPGELTRTWTISGLTVCVEPVQSSTTVSSWGDMELGNDIMVMLLKCACAKIIITLLHDRNG